MSKDARRRAANLHQDAPLNSDDITNSVTSQKKALHQGREHSARILQCLAVTHV